MNLHLVSIVLQIVCQSGRRVNCCFEIAEIDFASNIEGFLADEIRVWFRKGLRYKTQDVQLSVKDM